MPLEARHHRRAAGPYDKHPGSKHDGAKNGEVHATALGERPVDSHENGVGAPEPEAMLTSSLDNISSKKTRVDMVTEAHRMFGSSSSAGRAEPTLAQYFSQRGHTAPLPRTTTPNLMFGSDSDSRVKGPQPPCHEGQGLGPVDRTSFRARAKLDVSSFFEPLFLKDVHTPGRGPIWTSGVGSERAGYSGDAGATISTHVVSSAEGNSVPFLRDALRKIQQERDYFKSELMRLRAEMAQKVASHESDEAALRAKLGSVYENARRVSSYKSRLETMNSQMSALIYQRNLALLSSGLLPSQAGASEIPRGYQEPNTNGSIQNLPWNGASSFSKPAGW